MNVVLIGFKSCGKSTVGALFAARQGMTFVDTDTLIVQHWHQTTGERRTCRELYAQLGAEALRELETSALEVAAQLDNAVIATGGGMVLRPENRERLRQAGVCVFLDTLLPVLEQRLAGVVSPLFAQRSVAEVHAERLPLYCQTAHLHLTPERDDPERICISLSSALSSALNTALHTAVQESSHGQQ